VPGSTSGAVVVVAAVRVVVDERRGAVVTGAAATAIVSVYCAYVTLSIAAVTTLTRFFVYRHRWFLLSVAALAHIVLHALLGWSYLVAGSVIAVATAVVLIASGLGNSRAEAGVKP